MTVALLWSQPTLYCDEGADPMFFKGISALLAAAIAYFIYQNGFDTQMSVYFALMPIATLMGYLLLGVSD